MARVSKRELQREYDEVKAELNNYKNYSHDLEFRQNKLRKENDKLLMEKAELQEKYDKACETQAKLVIEYAKYVALQEVIKENLENFEVIKGETHIFE